MSQPPTPYARIFDFEAFSTNNPGTQQPGVQFEGEFDAIKLTLDGLVSRLAEIQRSDGKFNPAAFENTDIVVDITDQAYASVYSLLNPLVIDAAAHAAQAGQSATQAQNSATQAATFAAAALLHRNSVEAAVPLATAAASQAAQSSGTASVNAGQAQSAAYEAEQSKLSAQTAKTEAEAILSSVQTLGGSLNNQYDNMLDADQNLSDVSNKSQSVTNLGLDAADPSHRSIYNRFCGLLHMYVDPNAQNYNGAQTYLGIDQYLAGMFNLKFNHQTSQFEKAGTSGGSYFGIQSANGHGQSPPDSTLGNKTVEQLVEVLKIRLSVVSSIFRQTLFRANKYYGFNGDNRIITLQELMDNPGGQFDSWAWGLVSQNVSNTITNAFYSFDAPQDGKQYARKDLGWVEVAASGGGISEYDNFKVYNANDIVWLGSFVYRFNAFIGAAGYGPVTHPAAWTKLSASEISDISGLQSALDAKASTVALSAGLAGKANTSHSHSISNVTGLQAALDGKASSSHVHAIGGIQGLQTALDAKTSNQLPYYYSYNQGTTVINPGQLTILAYDGGTNGTVSFSAPVGSRFFFYQSANASNPIAFNGAVQNENKLFTKGPKSWVEAVVTPEGVVINGDLMFPPSGYLISSSCDYVYGYSDAQGVTWDGAFYSNQLFADGSGGTYSGGGYNQNGCWYPYGFCLESGITLSESTLSWSGCSSSGTYVYSSGYGNRRADGSGGTYDEYMGGWSASSGDVIYDGGSCLVKYDGTGGYYVEDNSGNSGYPSYGSYIGQGSGTIYTYYGYNIGDLAVGTYTNDQYADGNGGVAYTENQYNSYYGYGTYLAYDDYNGYSVYSDGNGSYYTSA